MLLKLLTLLTCASVILTLPDLDSVANDSPPEDHFLIYDIKGDVTRDEVMDTFSGFNVPYKFRSLSGQRYVVVLKMDTTDHTAYTSIAFPASTQVDVYHAELLSDLYRYFGLEGLDDKDVITYSDDNLLLIEFSFDAWGDGKDKYKSDMKNLLEEYRDFNNNHKTRVFHFTGVLPFKVFVFVSLSPSANDRVVIEGGRGVGGPFQTTVHTTPIANM